MDFIEALPKSKGFDTILVIADRFTKYAYFLPFSHPFFAKEVAQKFIYQVCKLHSMPKTVVTNIDRLFTSLFYKEMFKMMGTQLNFGSAYHPESDGQTKRVERCLEVYLRCLTFNNRRKWSNWLSTAEWWYNSNFHTALKMTPFQALYGYEAK